MAVLTPLGAGGMGGIDRIMDRLRIGYAGRSDIQCFFMTTRGKGHIALAPLFLAATIMRIVVLKILRRLDVAHNKRFGSRQYVSQAHCSLCFANAPDSLCGPSSRGNISAILG